MGVKDVQCTCWHVFAVLPEGADDILVGAGEGDEREMVCLEPNWRECHYPAVSYIVAARGADDANAIVLETMRNVGIEVRRTVATEIERAVKSLQSQEVIPRTLNQGLITECPGGFLVSGNPEAVSRAWRASLANIGVVLDE